MKGLVIFATVFVAGTATLASAFSASSSPNAAATPSAYEIIRDSPGLLDPITGEPRSESILVPSSSSSAEDGGTNSEKKKKSLVVVLPQLGEFDAAEYCEFLIAARGAMTENGIDLRVVGIGDPVAARAFCGFTGLPPGVLSLDPGAGLHRELGLYAGPGFSVPPGVPDGLLRFFLRQLPGGIPPDETDLRPAAEAWLNYNAMCAGIGAPGTLPEILRGYLGDRTAPERFRDGDVVEAGFVTIGPGVGPTRIGPFAYDQWFSDERGYQRPVELATVRLKVLAEALTRWDDYVSNLSAIPQRGGTFLFDADGNELYSHRSRGVLTYSETMPRPLSFLAPYIGEEVALNPLGLPDTGYGDLTRGRGVWKPAGKLMGFLAPVFRLETRLQARLLGAEEPDFETARKDIEATLSAHRIVVYGYSLSPFSAEAEAVLDEIGADYETVWVGPEWFLLDRERSTLRAELLEMTGQSSLPHVFIDGEHVGGLATGTPDGTYPGLAALKESGKLREMMIRGSVTTEAPSPETPEPEEAVA